jgi:hypothetical protein
MNFSETLMKGIRALKAEVPLKLDSMAAVIRNLQVLYDTCLASESLLLNAEREAQRIDDAVLSDYYGWHYLEEKDEVGILKEDLKGAVNNPPNPIAMAMIGTQYYLINHVHPVCLLGYMAIMEADPMPIERVEELEREYGKELFRFIRLHAIKDIEHARELLVLIDERPANQQQLIALSTDNALKYLYG